MLCFLLTEKIEYLLNDSIPEHQDLLLPELSNLAYLLDNSIYQNQSILEAMLLLAKKNSKVEERNKPWGSSADWGYRKNKMRSHSLAESVASAVSRTFLH